MRTAKAVSLSLLALLLVNLAGPQPVEGQSTAAQQATLAQLEAKFKKRYEAIEDLFLHGPAKKVFPPNPRERIARWQDELAESFARAGATIDEILKLHPADEAKWREQRETMWLYSQPISPPESRSVFGAGEVQKRARLVDAPAAAYPDTARAAKANGEVRLRLVLAADGTVKNIFPMKPLKHGLTEAAIDAARLIKFTPAMRNGKPVSQFETLSYEFKKGVGLKPYTPEHEFYF
ncbi:MAG: vitamin transporter [Blastocatellia bacterium]|jgi:TonB family protein|nr:vitamin transporter [Blastocatellia bacterium]